MRVGGPIGGHARRLGTLAVLAVFLAFSVPGMPALAISRAEVDEACVESQEAYDIYRAARSDFEEAATALDAANLELSDAEYREQRIRGLYQERQEEQAELRTEVASQAVELYMQAAAGPSMGMLSLSSPSQALTAFEFLKSSTDQNLQSVNDLSAVSSELDRLGSDLEVAVGGLTSARDQQQQLTDEQETSMISALGAYDQLTGRCKQLQAEYEAEQARIRAEEEARKQREAEARERATSSPPGRGSSGGGSSGAIVEGIICPFSPGRTHFTNSWGAPRSGGRGHRGTDLMAPFDEPIYAVTSGTVSTGNRGLGGRFIWLSSDGGTAFFYAHLNGFAVGDGASVSQGDLIGYNGNSGNASGGSPHLHFEIHPGGRGGGAVNPYNTLASVCY
jgi:peptidoglycan LD-endopeptidase LytH